MQPLNPAAPAMDQIRDRAVQRICNMTAVSTDTFLACQILLLLVHQTCMHAIFPATIWALQLTPARLGSSIHACWFFAVVSSSSKVPAGSVIVDMNS